MKRTSITQLANISGASELPLMPSTRSSRNIRKTRAEKTSPIKQSAFGISQPLELLADEFTDDKPSCDTTEPKTAEALDPSPNQSICTPADAKGPFGSTPS